MSLFYPSTNSNIKQKAVCSGLDIIVSLERKFTTPWLQIGIYQFIASNAIKGNQKSSMAKAAIISYLFQPGIKKYEGNSSFLQVRL